MYDLGLAAMRVIERGQDVAHDRDLLVEGECQRVLRDVLPQGMSGHVLGDQHEPILALVRKEFSNRQYVRMTRHRRHRTEGVLDAPAFGIALCFREVRIDGIHPQPRTRAAPRTEQGMSGTVLRESIGAAELLLDLPVAVARRCTSRLGAPGDGPFEFAASESGCRWTFLPECVWWT